MGSRKNSGSGTRMMAVIPAVKPPLYRQKPPWKVTTVVTRTAWSSPAKTPDRLPNRLGMGDRAAQKHRPKL